MKATADTLFLVRDYDGDVTVYTGITNVPDVTIPQVASVAAAKNVTVTWTCTDSSKTYAEYVFIDVTEKNVDVDDVNDAADYLFLLKPTGDKTVVDGSTYYKYKVIIDGEETTKFVEETIVSGNKLGDLFTNIKENSKGYITNGKPFDGADAKKHIEPLDNGTITLKGETLSVAGKAFIVNSDADVNLIIGKGVTDLLKDVDAKYETYLHTSASAVASLLKGYDLNGKVYASLKDNGSEKVTALYIYISGAKESVASSVASVNSAKINGNAVTVYNTVSEATKNATVIAPSTDFALAVEVTGTKTVVRHQDYTSGAFVAGDDVTGWSNVTSASTAGKYTVLQITATSKDGSKSDVKYVAVKAVAAHTLTVKTSAGEALVTIGGTDYTVTTAGTPIPVNTDSTVFVTVTGVSGSNTLSNTTAGVDANATLWNNGAQSWKVSSFTGNVVLTLTLS